MVSVKLSANQLNPFPPHRMSQPERADGAGLLGRGVLKRNPFVEEAVP
jgi:hypothetical protein